MINTCSTERQSSETQWTLTTPSQNGGENSGQNRRRRRRLRRRSPKWWPSSALSLDNKKLSDSSLKCRFRTVASWAPTRARTWPSCTSWTTSIQRASRASSTILSLCRCARFREILDIDLEDLHLLRKTSRTHFTLRTLGLCLNLDAQRWEQQVSRVW